MVATRYRAKHRWGQSLGTGGLEALALVYGEDSPCPTASLGTTGPGDQAALALAVPPP